MSAPRWRDFVLTSRRFPHSAAGANSIVFSRAGSEPPVQYENRNFRQTVKNGKTGSLDPSMTMDWMERTGNVSYFRPHHKPDHVLNASKSFRCQ
jgi:hypothetical protein